MFSIRDSRLAAVVILILVLLLGWSVPGLLRLTFSLIEKMLFAAVVGGAVYMIFLRNRA